MPRRPKTIHRFVIVFFIVFFIVGIGAISSIPFNIITTLFTQGASALDPRVWQKIYLVQLARQYPIATSIIGLGGARVHACGAPTTDQLWPRGRVITAR